MNVLIGMSSSKRGDVCVGPLVPTPHYAQPFCLSIQSDISESNVCMCEVIINGFFASTHDLFLQFVQLQLLIQK